MDYQRDLVRMEDPTRAQVTSRHTGRVWTEQRNRRARRYAAAMIRVRRPLGLSACCLALVIPLLAACGSSSTPTATKTVTATVTPATTPSPSKLTAMEITNALIKAGLPATKVVAQTESTDPNKFLGRPGKYTERVSFDVPGGDPSGEVGDTSRGGVIELWPSQADAQTRADYVQAVLKSMGSEYDYVHGPALVRITGEVLPSVAKKFQVALATMP